VNYTAEIISVREFIGGDGSLLRTEKTGNNPVFSGRSRATRAGIAEGYSFEGQ